MFEFDGWLDWEPDPERAAREADLVRESYLALTKPQVLEMMANAKGGREWEFLQELFLDRCTAAELEVGIEDFIKNQYVVFGFEELCFLEGAIEPALRRRDRLRLNTQIANLVANEPRFPLNLPERIPPTVPLMEKSG